MMGYKLILNFWHNLFSVKHFLARYLAKINGCAANGASQLAPVSDQKERHRRFKYGFLGATVPLSLGMHGLILPIASSWYGSHNSVIVANNQSEVLIDVSVVERPSEIITPAPVPATAHSPNIQTSDDDSIAALPSFSLTNGNPNGNGGTIPSPPSQEPKTPEPTTSPQAAKAGNLAPDNTLPQSDPSKSTPTPPAPSPIASFNPMIDRLLTSSSFHNNQVAPPLNVGGGKSTTASLVPSGIGQIGRGLGWGNTGNRSGGFGNSNLSSNNIGLFSGRLGIPFGSPSGRGNSNNVTGNGSGNSANNGNQNPDQSNGNGRGRIRCQECSKPQYPDSARERGLEGAATVAVDIAPDGTVTNVRILQSSGHPELDEAAINAARGWRYEASATGKQAVPAGRINFQIEGSEYAQSSQQQRNQPQADPPAVVPPSPSNTDTSIATQAKPTNPITAPINAPSNPTVTAPDSVVNNGNATPNLVPNSPSSNIPNPITPVPENQNSASQPIAPILDNPAPIPPLPTPTATPEAAPLPSAPSLIPANN